MTVALVRERPAIAPVRRMPAHVWMLAAVVAVGAVIRAVPQRSIWVDEAINIQQARLPYAEMLRQLASADLHPPLWASVLWLDVRVVGYSPFAVRLPALVIGVLCVPLAYFVARELFDRRTGMLAAVFTAVSPIAVWYSGEARMYGFYLFFALLAVLGQARAIRRGRPRDWALFAVASAALLYTQYFSALQLLAQHLVFLALILRNRRSLLVPWLLSAAGTVVLVAPLLPYLGEQLGHFSSPGASPGTGSGRPVSLYVVMANLAWGMWGYHADAVMTQIVALWPAGMLLTLVLLGKGRSWPGLLLAALVGVPLFCAFLLSARARTFFELRYFISILPPMLILSARAVTGWLTTTSARAVAAAAVALTLVVGLADQQFGPGNPRQYDYDAAFRLVNEEAQPGDLILFAPDYLGPVVDYYEPNAPAQAISEGGPLPIEHHGRIVLVASFLDQPATATLAGEALAQLELNGRSIRRTVELENVTLWILG